MKLARKALTLVPMATLVACTGTSPTPPPVSSGSRIGSESGITRSADSLTLPDGDLVIVGSTSGSIAPEGRQGSVDALVVRAANDGTLRWARQLGGPGAPIGLVVKAWSVALGSANDILVAGLVNGRPSFEGRELVATFSGFVASFAREDGDLRWLSLLADASGPTEMMGVSVLSDGTVLASGYTATTSLHGSSTLGAGDVVLAWFTPDGARLSVKRFGGTDEEYPTAFVVRDDRIYFARRAVDASLGQVLSLELVALDSDGEWRESVLLEDPASTEIASLAVHPDGVCSAMLFRTYTEAAGAGADYGLRCFDDALEVLGEARHGEPGVGATPADVACDDAGGCALVGTLTNGGLSGEPLGIGAAAFVARYSRAHELESAVQYGPDEIGDEHFARGTSISYGPEGGSVIGDVSGTLFGEPMGSVDTFISRLD